MNKAEVVAGLSGKSGLPKKQVEELVDAFLETITEALKSGQEVVLTGFGSFSSKVRQARLGVNPLKPSEKIQIPAVRVPKFKAGKNLKEALK